MELKSRHKGDAFEGAFASKVRLWFKGENMVLNISESDEKAYYHKLNRLAQANGDRKAMEEVALKAVYFALAENKTFFASQRGEYLLRLNDDAADPFDVRDATLTNPKNEELGFSLKWRNDEIKSPRLGLGWLRQFQLPDDGYYEQQTEDIVSRLSAFDTWEAAKLSLGNEAVHRPFNDGLVRGIEQIMGDPDATRLFARFIFGSVDHVKVSVSKDKKRVTFADYRTRNLPSRIKHVEADRLNVKWVHVVFDKGWSLKFRLHSRKADIPTNVRSSMGLGVTVAGWGGSQVLTQRI